MALVWQFTGVGIMHFRLSIVSSAFIAAFLLVLHNSLAAAEPGGPLAPPRPPAVSTYAGLTMDNQMTIMPLPAALAGPDSRSVQYQILYFSPLPEGLAPRDGDAFYKWFSDVYLSRVPESAEPPLRTGWQDQRSHVHVFSDRLVIDAPMPPGIGATSLNACRITVPLTRRANTGVVVDASNIGSDVSMSQDGCVDRPDRPEDIPELLAYGRKNDHDRDPVVIAKKDGIGRLSRWNVQQVVTWNIAATWSLMSALRAAGDVTEPTVFLQKPVAADQTTVIDPLEYTHFYADGRMVTTLTLGLSVKGGDGNLPLSTCIIRPVGKQRAFDGDPAVAAWCRKSAEVARKKIDAAKLALPLAVAPPR